jgi:hypothetical protein
MELLQFFFDGDFAENFGTIRNGSVLIRGASGPEVSGNPGGSRCAGISLCTVTLGNCFSSTIYCFVGRRAQTGIGNYRGHQWQRPRLDLNRIALAQLTACLAEHFPQAVGPLRELLDTTP